MLRYSTIGPSASAGKVRECTDDEHDKDKPDDEERAVIPKRPVTDRYDLLYDKRSRERDGDDGNGIAPDKHCKCGRKIVKDAVGRQSAKCAAVVLGSRAERIQDLREPMRPGVEDCR